MTKVSAFDAWLEKHERALFKAAENLQASRGARSATCSGCRHKERTYASPPCSDCAITGTEFQPEDENAVS
jgi:hypothetical protein